MIFGGLSFVFRSDFVHGLCKTIFSNTVYIQENVRKFCWQINFLSYYQYTGSDKFFPGYTHSDYFLSKSGQKLSPPPPENQMVCALLIKLNVNQWLMFNLFKPILIELNLLDLKICLIQPRFHSVMTIFNWIRNRVINSTVPIFKWIEPIFNSFNGRYN